MALTLTQAELSAAIRLGDSAEEVAEATRLLGYVTAAITQHLGASYEAAPEAIVNEAAIRLAGYLFDMPNAGRGLSYANAGRNSGAWAILLPYRIHRAGSTGEAVAAAQEAIGTTDNQVTGRRGRLRLLGCHLGGRINHAASPAGHGRQRGPDCP